MANATEFLKRFRLKSIDTLFYTMYSVSLKSPHNINKSYTAASPSLLGINPHQLHVDGGDGSDLDLDSSADPMYKPLRAWQTERLQFLCTTVVPWVFAVVIAFALVGNLIVIYVVARQKKLHTPLNVFFVSLAFSDVTMVVMGLPFTAYGYASDSWLIGDVICRVHNYVNMTSIFVSVYTMVAVATYRCRLMVTMTSSHEVVGGHHHVTSVHQSAICVSVIWAVMIVLNVPILLLYTVKSTSTLDGGDFEYLSCELTHIASGKYLFLTFFVLGYLLPLSIAMTCYGVIIVLLRRQVHHSSLHSGARKRNVRVTSLLVIVLLTFTLCWLPLHVQLLYAFTGHDSARSYEHEVFRVLTFCLAYSSTVINPIVYSFACADFRECFDHMFMSVVRQWCCWTKTCDRHLEKDQGRDIGDDITPLPYYTKQDVVT